MKKLIPEDAVLVPDEAQRVFEGEIFDVYQWQQPLFDGTDYRFEMLKRADTVSVICVVDDKILVLDDEQPHLGMRKSFPGGRIDKTDNDVVAAAQREVREETGYGFNNWRLVKVWQPYRKIEWFVHVLLAWEVSEQSEPTPDAGEKISVQQMGFSALKELIMKREGYLGESIDLFGEVEDIDQLLLLPEFQGRQVDR